ncbi:MAG: hypothetical protein KA105_08445 [Caulobacter sp.]|nr:hypothetical protein [Caulobacter sp.]
MAEPDSVMIEVTVAASVDEVWDALRDPAQLTRWFGWDSDSLQAEIQYIFFDHAEADDGKRVLRFGGMPDRFEVEARGDGAVVRLIRAGSTRTTEDWGGVYDDMITGWITFIQQLAFLLNEHRGQDRRTLYLSGMAADAAAPKLSTALGLDPIRTLAVGERYALDGPGERLAGTVRFTTALMTGVSVDGWSGLLIVIDRPHGTGGLAEAGGYVVLTTYGQDDAAFAALEGRWKGWWSERYPNDRPGLLEPDSPFAQPEG